MSRSIGQEAARTEAAEPAPEVFSTVGLPASRRVELWEGHNAAALVRLDVHAISPLQASEVSIRLADATLARVRATSHRIERSSDAITADPYDAIAVYLSLRGESSFVQGGITHTLRPGNAVICETDRPFAREFAHGLDELVVKVPCEALDALDARLDAHSLKRPVVMTFGSGDDGDQYASALARLAARATRAVQPVPADERAVVELVTVLAAGPQAARSAAYRAAARAFIEEHLTAPGLGADQVAAAIGISERHLSRVFAADGTSVPRFVLARRLELSHALLCAAAPADSVADIAARCGFVSTTYFSHVFRARFGLRAGEVLRASRAVSTRTA